MDASVLLSRSQRLLQLGVLAIFTAVAAFVIVGHADATSPDGSQIVFTSTQDGNDEIYVIDVDGTNLTRLTANAITDAYPVWSPDGTKIAFHREPPDGRHQIFVMNADGSGQTQITNDPVRAIFPDWQPLVDTPPSVGGFHQLGGLAALEGKDDSRSILPVDYRTVVFGGSSAGLVALLLGLRLAKRRRLR